MLRRGWSYGRQLWNGAAKSNLDEIKITHMKVLRSILKAKWYERKAAICADLNIDSMEGCITKMYSAYETHLHCHRDKRPSTSILAMAEAFTLGTSTFNCWPTWPSTSILAMAEAFTFGTFTFNCWPTCLVNGKQRVGSFVLQTSRSLGNLFGSWRHPKLIIHHVGRPTAKIRVMPVAPL